MANNESIHIRLPPEMRQALLEKARGQNRTLSNLILIALKQYLEDDLVLTAFKQYLKDNEPKSKSQPG